VNRAKLSERFTPHTAGRPVAANNQVEEKVLGIYREVLGAETLGPGDNFFALGGDSLRATQVINRVRVLFAVNLSIATIFRKPTVADLATEIAQTIPKEYLKTISQQGSLPV
jgi:acyl carrier protein